MPRGASAPFLSKKGEVASRYRYPRDILLDRFEALMALLRDGRVSARTDQAEIPKATWAGSNFYLDTVVGDLFEKRSKHRRFVGRWRDITVHAATSVERVSNGSADAAPDATFFPSRGRRGSQAQNAIGRRGIDLKNTPLSKMAIAQSIGPLMDPPARNANELDALTKVIARLQKNSAS